MIPIGREVGSLTPLRFLHSIKRSPSKRALKYAKERRLFLTANGQKQPKLEQTMPDEKAVDRMKGRKVHASVKDEQLIQKRRNEMIRGTVLFLKKVSSHNY